MATESAAVVENHAAQINPKGKSVRHLRKSQKVFALLLAIVTAPAVAGWRYLEPQGTTRVAVQAFLLARDGAIWTQTPEGVRRVGASGGSTLALGRANNPGLDLYNYRPEVALPGGGIVVSSEFPHPLFAGVDANGRLRWQRSHPGIAFVRTNAAGDLWVTDNEALTRLRADGTAAVRVEFPSISPFGRPYALTVDDTGAAIVAINGRVAKIAPNGTVLWSVEHFGNVREFPLTSATDITVVGDDGFQLGNPGTFQVRRLDARTGAERWLRTSAEPRTYVVDAQPADTGAFYVLGRSTTTGTQPAVLMRVAADGSIAWRHDICALPTSLDATLAVDADGNATVACRAGERAHALRFDRTGAATGNVELPLTNATQAQWRSDGTLLVVGRGVGTGATAAPRFAVLDRTLTPVPSPLAELTQSEPLDLVYSIIADDGSTYLLTRPNNAYEIGTTQTLTRVAANGQRMWTRQISELRMRTLPPFVGADRVCLVDNREVTQPWPTGSTVACFAADDGEPLWQHDYDNTEQTIAVAGRVLDDGTFTLVRNVGDARFEIVRIATDGTVASITPGTGGAAYVAIAANGRVVVPVDYLRPSAKLFQFDAAGRQVYAIAGSTLGANWLGMSDTQIYDDGSVAVLGRRSGTPPAPDVLWMLKPDGTERWQRDLGVEYGPAEIRASRDALYLRQLSFRGPVGPNRPDVPIRLMRIDAAEGAVRWQQSSTIVPRGGSAPYGAFAVTPAGDKVLALDTRFDRLRVRRYDAADGTLEQERHLACIDQCSNPDALRVFANGRTIATQKTHEPQRGSTALVTAWDDLVADALPIRIDQPGIAGSWWSPYANGEGFVLDWLPDSRTLFMPWFTFSRDGGNDPAGQRWYVVQGAVPADATQVELPITETTGGVFDAGPSVTPTIVGTATLSFTDCDNGTLRYRFDEGHNGAASGTITLSRLSPATQNCILADGSTQTRTVAPANGFDARMSGSWFEPATSGQGMQLTVQPGGIFFAPWFTFDPAGASDDPGKQRWFTIQGSIAGARNGVATLPIVQTIGGAFDSVPTNNMYAVGSATITMLACDRAKVDYRFDDNELAAAMRNRSGSIDLVKAGGCMR
jgi:outer membrane protein assembly factor BamB